LRIITLLFALIFITTIRAQSVDDIVEEIQEIYDDLKYLSADFIQVEKFNLTGAENKTSGKIYVKDGIKYRLETEDRTIVTDEITVWTYSVFNNQVLIDKAKKDDGAMLPRDLLFKYPREYYASLLDKVTYKGKDHYILKLDPKEDTHGYIKSMKIWVDDDSYLIAKIEYTDLNDNQSAFEIEKINTAKELPDTFFKFEPPEGSDVVDLRM
jgi:chaperone LolA